MSCDSPERLTLFKTYCTADLLIARARERDAKRLFLIDRQLSRIDKRFRGAASQKSLLHIKSWGSFLETNDAVKAVRIGLTSTEIAHARLFITQALEKFTSRYVDVPQCEFDLPLILNMWRFGPGSSAGIHVTHFVQKILSGKFTCTQDALPYVELLVKTDPHLLPLWRRGSIEFEVVEGSSMTTVAKDQTKRRTICSEPLGNMALQLGAGMYIEGALRSIGIDIQNQADINNQTARLASIHGNYATIDMKNASDMISLRLFELLWPQSWVHFLKKIRSGSTSFAFGLGGVVSPQTELNMLSTMGNGFTFPLMTLTFLALLDAVYAKHGEKFILSKYRANVAIFGDDIICPSSMYEDVCSVFSRAGLLINRDKSYSRGPFRESCGGDYFNGLDVTPFYVEILDCQADVHVAINKLREWSTRNGIMLKYTHDYLISLLQPYGQVLLVPEWEDPESGVLSHRAPRRYYLLEREPMTCYIKSTMKKGAISDALMLCVLRGYLQTTDRGDTVSFVRRLIHSRETPKFNVVKRRYPRGWTSGAGSVSYRSEVERLFLEVFYDF